MFSVIIPDVDGCKATGSTTELVRVGLADLVPGSNQLAIPEGPTGTRCVHWTWPRPGEPADHNYDPDSQIWMPAVAWDGRPAGRYWIGYDKAKPLGPEQLKRSKQLPGSWVVAGDGNRWLIPSVSTLPCDWVPGNGGWTRELPEEYQPLSIAASEMAFRVTNSEAGTLLDNEIFDFVLRFLQLNYRLPRELLGKIRLFNDSNAAELFWRALNPEMRKRGPA